MKNKCVLIGLTQFTGRVDCDDDPCKNGGTCVSTDKGFRCECPDGFKGKYCKNKIGKNCRILY